MPPTDDDTPIEPLETFDPIRTARRRHGAAGAIVAAGMFGLDQALMGRKAKEEVPIVMAASDEPVDIDHEGIKVPVDDIVSVIAPPQPRSDPLPSRRRRGRRR
ncbi:MAG: hypothetical protein M3P52_03545 [Actinomycetota bacterium]|nr:hypothetical protein [Actinomycetota bacterium]